MLPHFGKFNGILVGFLVLANITAKTYSDRGDFLSRLLASKNGPVVVFLESERLTKGFQVKDVVTNDVEESLEGPYVPGPGEQDAYILFTVLRSTQQEEDLDTKAARIFEKSKNLLRTAFALRCAKRNNCEKKCPPKDNGCQSNCQKEFDELEACDDEEKEKEDGCKKEPDQCANKWPKTMPPKWLRALARQGPNHK